MRVDLFDKWAPILVCGIWVWVSIRTTSWLRRITRQTVAHTRRTVWLIKFVATVVAAGNVFGAALAFHLRWFLGAILAAVTVLFALTDKVEAIVPGKPPQDPSAYSQAWREYLRLRKNAYLSAILLVLVGLSGFALTAAIGPGLTFWIVATAILGLFSFWAFNEWKREYWPCPRCGYRFRGFWIPVMPKRCNHCSLPLWSENPTLVGDMGAKS